MQVTEAMVMCVRVVRVRVRVRVREARGEEGRIACRGT